MRKRMVVLGCLVCVGIGGTWVQNTSAVPPPKSVDEGPNLEVTMKFIQDELKFQGAVQSTRVDAYVDLDPNKNFPPTTYHRSYEVKEGSADAATCTLKVRVTNKYEWSQPTDFGSRTPLSGSSISDDLWIASFKDVEKIMVDTEENVLNHVWMNTARQTHTAIAPAVFLVALVGATTQVFKDHRIDTDDGKQEITDHSYGGLPLYFRNEDMANRVAKAMFQAVDLCGGGKPELKREPARFRDSLRFRRRES